MSNSFFNAAIASVFWILYDRVNCFLKICKQLENVSWNLSIIIYYIYIYINETSQRHLKLIVSCLQNHSANIFNLKYIGIKITKQWSDVNCVKSIRIRGWSGTHFATFWVNNGTFSVNPHSQSECRKKSHQKKNSEHRHFPHSGQVL